MVFFTTLKHYVRPTLPRFFQKLCFDTKLAKKPNFSDFETIFGFCSSLLVDSISTLKITIFYIPYVFYRNLKALCQANFAAIFLKIVFWHKIGWKAKLLRFWNDLWVFLISSIRSHINFTNCKNPLEMFSIFILSSRGEQARNWA